MAQPSLKAEFFVAPDGIIVPKAPPLTVNERFAIFDRDGDACRRCGAQVKRFRAKGRGKTLAYRNWRAFADRELRDQPSWHVPGKVKVVIRVGGSRNDSDNNLKAVLDALVAAGRIQDDSPKYVTDSRSIHDATVSGTRIEIERAA